jgi:hypothetical protein
MHSGDYEGTFGLKRPIDASFADLHLKEEVRGVTQEDERIGG